MIHYHGTPITPRSQLLKMAGRHFCVSFAAPRDAKTCLQIGQSVMLDNGAYSVFTRGGTLDVRAYYEWLEPILTPPHWAVVPDVIGGELQDQYKMLTSWPRETLGYDNAAAVFHLNEPLNHLWFLCNAYPKVCLGSSGEYWQIGTPKWVSRMDEIFNYLATRGQMPWIHGLRMLSQTSGGWPLASADSTNIARNFKNIGRYQCPETMADKIDSIQPASHWVITNKTQGQLLES